MLSWNKEPWAKNPEVLIENLERFYRLAILCGKVETVAKTTARKVMQIREWCPNVPQDNLLRAIEELEVIYIPQGVAPGPALMFPIRDVTGEVRWAHIRVSDETVYGVRYIAAVNRSDFIGPAWLGTDEQTLTDIIHHGRVLVMEGPLDLLAIKTMAPGLPAICSLTKKLSRDHWDYLKMLGVTTIHVMFDNEIQGDAAAERAVEKHPDFEILQTTCPAKDPAACLKSSVKMQALYKILSGLTPSTGIIQEVDD